MRCDNCGRPVAVLTPGFNEEVKRRQDVCIRCERSLGPRFKKTLCERDCIIGVHVHASIGPISLEPA